MDFIKTLTDKIYPLSKESLELYRSIFTEKKFKKNETLIASGEIATKFYILKEGIVRSYAIDQKGKDHTRSFFIPISSTGALESLITKKPSNSNYQCLTDCVLLEGDFIKLEEILKNNHELTTFYSKTLEFLFLILLERINELSSLNATENYINLRKKMPEIDNLIQQYHIASYLNITPVQLSRIRKELFSK